MLKATGTLGRLKVGFHRAADIGNWNLIYKPESVGIPYADVEAAIKCTDQFWMTQLPMSLGLHMGQSWWVWHQVTVSNTGKRIFIRVTGNPVAIEQF